MTSDISLKEYKHLIPFIIVTRSLSQPHPTLQILRHTSLLPGQFPGRLAALVTQTPSIAVPLAFMRRPLCETIDL